MTTATRRRHAPVIEDRTTDARVRLFDSVLDRTSGSDNTVSLGDVSYVLYGSRDGEDAIDDYLAAIDATDAIEKVSVFARGK